VTPCLPARFVVATLLVLGTAQANHSARRQGRLGLSPELLGSDKL